MSKKNRVTTLASLRKMEDQALPVVITSEMMASMPIEAVEEELREMGLVPDQSLPMVIRHIIDDGKIESPSRIKYYQYVGNKAYKRLLNAILIPTFLTPKCLSYGRSIRKVVEGILMLFSRQHLYLHAVLILILAIVFANLINNGPKRSGKHIETTEIAMSQSIILLYAPLVTKSPIAPSVEHGTGHVQSAHKSYFHAMQVNSNDKIFRDTRLSSEDI